MSKPRKQPESAPTVTPPTLAEFVAMLRDYADQTMDRQQQAIDAQGDWSGLAGMQREMDRARLAGYRRAVEELLEPIEAKVKEARS